MAEKMLVTQALNELKTLDARIERAINDAEFIAASKVSEKNAKPGVTKEEFNKNAIASMQSINDLIKRRELIKAAVIASNAITKVTIGDQEMTVAKAIDTKESIGYKITLLTQMQSQYKQSLAEANMANARMDAKIDELLITLYGKDGKEKITEADYAATADPYKQRNETTLVDPLKLKEQIDKLQEEIETFSSNVDAQLQISNCVTTIEI